MSTNDAYYSGGVRVVIDGVPVRLARKPSAKALALAQQELREIEKWRCTLSPVERREKRAKEAKEAIARYAETLGISVAAAQEKISAQHIHNADNPLIDLSMKYDL